MKSRVPTTDRSVSWRQHDFYYYRLLPAGRDYPQLLRDFNVEGRRDKSTQLVLDANLLADDSGHLELGLTVVSPDGRLLAYSVDRTGDEVYRLRFRDIDERRGPRRRGPRSYYGGAWSADSRLLLLHRARRGLPALPGVAARARHAVRRGRARARGTGRAVRAGPARDPERRPRRIWAESRDTREVWVVDAHDPTARRARSAAAGRGWSTTPSTPSSPTAPTRCCVVTNDDADGVPAGPLPGPPRRRPGPPRLGAGRGPRTRPSGSSAWTPSPTTSCSASAPRSAPPAGPARRRPRLGRLRGRPAVRGGDRRAVAQRGVRRHGAHGRRRVATSTRRVWSDVDLAPASAPSGTGRRPPGTTRRATSARPGPSPPADGTAVPVDAGAAPRHPARRDRPGPALRVRRLRGHATTRPGTPRCRACSTAGVVYAPPTSVEEARAGVAGGSTATSRTSRTPSPTTSPWPTGSPGSSTAPGWPRAGSAPVACSREPC